MSETLAESILSAMPRIRCACGGYVGFKIDQSPSFRGLRFFARHGDQALAEAVDEQAFYAAYCSRVSAIHAGVATLRKMAERLMEDCQHAAWNSNAPYTPIPTAEIEFRGGHIEQMAIRASGHTFDAESRLAVPESPTKSATFPAPRSILR